MKPVIGITSYIKKDVFRSFSQVGYEYIDKIEKAGGIPLILPVLQKYGLEELDKIVYHVDGIVFTGGSNINSSWYGEDSVEEQNEEDNIRDKFEKDLFITAKRNKKPMLGICRGCQLINVMQNGSLIQKIDNEINTNVCHKGKGQKIYDMEHEVCFDKDSDLKKIYNSDKILVNSFHEQCIKHLGENLKITARCCEDGIPEAIEYQGDFYMIGIQWHPEAFEDQMKLFNKFVETCVKSSNS
ncbi:gamma-glutamyl-gamma-aminobutyrate hydrolase family protein [Clostridium sp. SM-530-WT-3G]|uniref:gamma-glutamyl-gamma-aminobutyrate hydrolase family protein n=1 Tax=Clostridium sp. SM-530-WT-3G TaxID=2725303 RepID=UPI00145D4039|nr:gamma-glutamyl-gamma-aminobutyrate hydrolase family protein [Clostridium sp. SM-530-WT-3G]NME82693.1 gamma-glutamyl-gamma-aminobutyrate hydrolase family protein [Clostridium sp. SM-530-WT-3G]